MKKYLISILVIFSFSLILVCACVTNDNACTYTIEYSATDGGYIDGETTQNVESGNDGLTVVAVPNDSYEFVKWSDGRTEATRQDINVTADISVTAEFKVKIAEQTKEYTVTYQASEGGIISGNAEQSIREGEDGIEIVAVPDIGYKFVKWSDNVTSPERQDKDVTADITVTAIFEKQTYTLSYVAGVGGYLIGNTNQTVAYGDNATIINAIPNDGYKFVKWSDGKKNDTRHDTEINSAISVTAEFEFLFAGGEGTQLNPYKIENYTQLLNMRYYPDKVYKLTCDLDLSGINHKPIFDDNEYFTGMFFGGGKTIKNLTVETESNFPSLFGMVMGGLVENFNLENVSIITTDFNTIEEGMQYYVGTVAGYFVGRMDNVTVSGNVTVNGLSYDGVAIGGLVGRATGKINDCFCDVRINVKNVYSDKRNLPFIFGGMLGIGDSVDIKNCSVQGEINVTECFWFEEGNVGPINTYTEIYIGGIVGYYFTDREANCGIRDSVTNVTIIGDNHYNAGGFVGYLEVNQDTSMQISGCSAHGDITIGVVGGFICNGYTYGELLIENCYTDCEIIGYSRAAGFFKTYSGLDKNCIIRNCYSLSNLKTHNVFDSEIIVGEAWGFGYQLSNMEIINCYAFGNINSSRGGGFAWNLSRCELECCYSNCNITVVESTYSVFIYSLSYTDVKNCYSKDIINLGSEIESNTFVVIKRLVDSQINNFYYAGNAFGAFIDIVSNSVVTNCHILRSSEQATDLIGNIVGDSSIDISDYKVPEEMYFLADKLNSGQEEVWVNQDKDFPALNFKN